ncbi:hypothetical protein STENM36S_08133 [Streptomyces tendae]
MRTSCTAPMNTMPVKSEVQPGTVRPRANAVSV